MRSGGNIQLLVCLKLLQPMNLQLHPERPCLYCLPEFAKAHVSIELEEYYLIAFSKKFPSGITL